MGNLIDAGLLFRSIMKQAWWLLKFHTVVLRLIAPNKSRKSAVGKGLFTLIKKLYKQDTNELVSICKFIERDSEAEHRTVEDKLIYQLARAITLIKSAKDKKSNGNFSELEWSMRDCFEKIKIDAEHFSGLLGSQDGILNAVNRVKAILAVCAGFSNEQILEDAIGF